MNKVMLNNRNLLRCHFLNIEISPINRIHNINKCNIVNKTFKVHNNNLVNLICTKGLIWVQHKDSNHFQILIRYIRVMIQISCSRLIHIPNLSLQN